MTRIHSTLLLLALFSLLVWAGGIAAAQAPALEILEPELKITLVEDTEQVQPLVVSVRNNTDAARTLQFQVELYDSAGRVTRQPVPTTAEKVELGPHSVEAVALDFGAVTTAETLRGFLVVQTPGVPPAAAPLTISFEKKAADPQVFGLTVRGASAILWASFWTALLTLLLTLLLFARRGALGKIFTGQVGEIKVDLSKNWASTLTVFGGVLTSIVGAAFFPETPSILSKSAFQTLSTLFPILVIVAGFVVAVLGAMFGKDHSKDSCRPDNKVVLIKTKNGNDWVDTQKQVEETTIRWRTSPVLAFVLASVLVQWAVAGELFTLLVGFEELQIAGELSRASANLIQYLFLLLIGISIVYIVFTISGTLRQLSSEVNASGLKERPEPLPPVYLP